MNQSESRRKLMDEAINRTGVGSNVIDKLTAPPETVMEHLDRIGCGYVQEWDTDGPGFTLVVHSNDIMTAEEHYAKTGKPFPKEI